MNETEYKGVNLVSPSYNLDSPPDDLLELTRESGRLSHVIYPTLTEFEDVWDGGEYKCNNMINVVDLLIEKGLGRKIKSEGDYMRFHVGTGQENNAGFFLFDGCSPYSVESSKMGLTDAKGMGLIFRNSLNEKMIEKYPVSIRDIKAVIDVVDGPESVNNVVRSIFGDNSTFRIMEQEKKSGGVDFISLFSGLLYLSGLNFLKNDELSEEDVQKLISLRTKYIWTNY